MSLQFLPSIHYQKWKSQKIYRFNQDRANNLQDLEIKVENTFRNIILNPLTNVRRRFVDNLSYSLVQGGLFEHLR